MSSNEIIEADELFMHHLTAVDPDQEDIPANWIAGLLSRTTGHLYLQKFI